MRMEHQSRNAIACFLAATIVVFIIIAIFSIGFAAIAFLCIKGVENVSSQFLFAASDN